MRKKPLILALETSGRIGSAAIALGSELLAETTLPTPVKHSRELFPSVQKMLKNLNRKPSQINHIYISIGPGSFTGIRLAVTIAKTLHLAATVKIVAVDSLDIIAANATDFMQKEGLNIKTTTTILDAKRGQFFIAMYQNQNAQWEKTLPDCLMTPQQFTEKLIGCSEPVWLLGEGLVYYKDTFNCPAVRFIPKTYWTPKAAKLHILGFKKATKNQFEDALTLQPAYLRKPQAEENLTKSIKN